MVIDFSPFYDLNRNMDRLLNAYWTPSSISQRREAYPLINISEDDGHVYVRAELPGVKMEDVDITLVDSSLSIKGERKPMEGKYYRQERPTGVFQRVVKVNTPVDRDKVSATLKDGLLTVVLPKAEESKPRKISIT